MTEIRPLICQIACPIRDEWLKKSGIVAELDCSGPKTIDRPTASARVFSDVESGFIIEPSGVHDVGQLACTNQGIISAIESRAV